MPVPAFSKLFPETLDVFELAPEQLAVGDGFSGMIPLDLVDI